jgi:hypothetical protein
MKYASAELSVDRSVVRLTFDTVPEGYERFHRVTIHADNLITILVHTQEPAQEDMESQAIISRTGEPVSLI